MTFGALLTADTDGAALPAPERLHALVDEHRVVVLRGFAEPSGDALVDLARSLGEVLAWSFGAVNELRVHDDPKNYLYTSREVPFHWDGAFVGKIPAYILFHCVSTSKTGGETLFCDTTLLLDQASDEDIARWERIRITYTTEKVAHYGGSFTSPMIAEHPLRRGERTLRFAEPVNDLNPVQLAIEGAADADPNALIADMHARLRSPSAMLAHAWQPGDVVLADNHRLLHGRRAFDRESTPPRHIRRVNICK